MLKLYNIENMARVWKREKRERERERKWERKRNK